MMLFNQTISNQMLKFVFFLSKTIAAENQLLMYFWFLPFVESKTNSLYLTKNLKN